VGTAEQVPEEIYDRSDREHRFVNLLSIDAEAAYFVEPG
jgi:hypothetical protein